MVKPLEYAPESAAPGEEKSFAMLEKWQELFGDDEVSQEDIRKTVSGLGPNVNFYTVRAQLDQLLKNKYIESVERAGVQKYRLTMHGIRYIQTTR